MQAQVKGLVTVVSIMRGPHATGAPTCVSKTRKMLAINKVPISKKRPPRNFDTGHASSPSTSVSEHTSQRTLLDTELHSKRPTRVPLLSKRYRQLHQPTPQGVFPQNWGGTELSRTVTCMVLKTTTNDRRTSSSLP
ncbi:hypothetical protein TNCV_832571 [Trichonephila clavipes]|nr:hypothetical protein TNCV_832571 [Trichonephila clavipes]